MSMTSPSSGTFILDMVLKVEGEPQEAFLQHGLTIGRSASNTISIDDPAVEHIHARVIKNDKGGYSLRAETENARIVLPDGSRQELVELVDGLRFMIGRAELVCVKHRTRAASVVVTDNPWLVQCPFCHANLSDYSRQGQKCPQCGNPLIFFKGADTVSFEGWLPQRVGPYRIRAFVGHGGMGVVLRGLHSETDRPAAVKLLRLGDDPIQAKRFMQEADTLKGLAHPNIVSLQEFGQESFLNWLAMDWVDGATLAAEIQEYRKIGTSMPYDRIGETMEQVARGLVYLHGKGLVHRDLKPQNIMRSRDNLLKIVDFGLAKPTDKASCSTMLTQTGMVAGTSGYMSPEQAVGDQIDAASDIYSFGVICCELITLRRPTGSIKSMLDSHPDCPDAWQEFVESCLRDNPRSRPDATKLASDLQKIQEGRYWVTKSRGETPSRGVQLSAPKPQRTNKVITPKHRNDTAETPYACGTCLLILFVMLVLVTAFFYAVGNNGIRSYIDTLLSTHSSEPMKQSSSMPESKASDRATDTSRRKQVGAELEEWVAEGDRLYQEGKKREAFSFYIKAAEQGNPYAQTTVALMYFDGDSIPPNKKKAISWYRKAADNDYALAQTLLGICYFDGTGITKNTAEAVRLFKKAADNGCPIGQGYLACCYYNGLGGLQKHPGLTFKWAKSSADQNDSLGQFILGECYLFGFGVTRNTERAKRYYKLAADQGHIEAMNKLNVIGK